MKISQQELITIMSSIKKSFPCTIVAETEPRHVKMTEGGILNPYYKKIKKRAKIHGFANWIYQTEVNKRRIEEGKTPDFEAEPRKWGERLQGTPFVVYCSKYYLEMLVGEVKSVEFFTGKQRLDYEEIAPFLVSSPPPQKQQLDNPVILRDYALENIRSISFEGNEYIL